MTPAAPHPPHDRLTEREREVLHVISLGLSNQGIARRLNLSVKTVEAAIRSIFMKLDLVDDDGDQNRRVAAALWYRFPAEGESAGPSVEPILLDGPELAELVSTKPFDTIVSVLEQRAVTAGSVAWGLLAAAAWCATIVEDLGLAMDLAERSLIDTQPGSPQGVIAENLCGVIATFTGREPWDHERLDRLEAVASLPPTDPGRAVFDSIEPVLEIANWFTFADRPAAAARILDRRIDALDGESSSRSDGGIDPRREFALCCRAELDLRRGRWDRAEAALHPVLAASAESEGSSLGVGYASVLAARVEAARGRTDAAAIHLRNARQMSLERGDRSTLWRADAVEGFMQLMIGNPIAAMNVLSPLAAGATISTLKLPSVRAWEADLVEAQVRVGEVDAAIGSARWLADDVAATGSRWGAAMLDRVNGLVASTPSEAIAHLDASAAAFRALDAPFEAARSEHLAGLACLRDHRRVDALTRLRRALAVYEHLSAHPCAAAVDFVLDAPGSA